MLLCIDVSEGVCILHYVQKLLVCVLQMNVLMYDISIVSTLMFFLDAIV